ncbi:hypothetical protein QAD02_020061 [Eretmocerus hayati]|uniref:Uncharacterized protein n=1 Tax=Eretmocerus hayati TaxID=131215 RepID=A0ACC2PLV0_9HYME|nr:hypothetical protein QAD02_020061 [Eretmocerus hayati]
MSLLREEIRKIGVPFGPSTSIDVFTNSASEEGHLAKNCQNHPPQETTVIPASDVYGSRDVPSTNASPELNDGSPLSSEIVEENSQNVTFVSKKRQPPSSVSTEDHNQTEKILASGAEDQSSAAEKTKPASKKQKTPTSYTQEEIIAMIEPIKTELANMSLSQLFSLERLASFLSETHGKADILSNASKLSKAHPAVITALELMYPHLDTTLKARVTRITKKIGHRGGSSNHADESTAAEDQ